MKLRDKWGRFAKSRTAFKLKVTGSIFAMSFCLFLASSGHSAYKASQLVYVAEAWELPSVIRCNPEPLEDALVDIVWGGESGHYVPKEGETLPTFDPSRAMYASCIKIGGRHPKDCLSYGPFQQKIGTIQYYAPKVYGKTVTEKEARDIAEGLESAREFFVECSVNVRGCVGNWTTAKNKEGQILPKVSELVTKIRACRGIEI